MSNVIYRHLRHCHKHGKGGVTMAILVDGENVRYSCAVCSTKDQYNKKLGRRIARGRLLRERTNRMSGCHVQDGAKLNEVFEAIDKDFLGALRDHDDEWLPGTEWLREWARKYKEI